MAQPGCSGQSWVGGKALLQGCRLVIALRSPWVESSSQQTREKRGSCTGDFYVLDMEVADITSTLPSISQNSVT